MIESENAEKSESQKHEKGVSQFTNNKTNQKAVITNSDSKVHLSIYVVDKWYNGCTIYGTFFVISVRRYFLLLKSGSAGVGARRRRRRRRLASKAAPIYALAAFATLRDAASRSSW